MKPYYEKGRPFFVSTAPLEHSGAADNFDMLLNVLISIESMAKNIREYHVQRGRSARRFFSAALLISGCLAAATLGFLPPTLHGQTQSPNPGATQTPAAAPPQAAVPGPNQAAIPPRPPRPAGNIVVIDPAHGGTDLGARGTGGIRESEMVLMFADQIRKALEAQGMQVLQTRDGNDNPSFDDRSAKTNAQNGAVFVTLHISSTGIPGTARVYVMSEMPAASDTSGWIRWDRAQAPFLSLSKKLGDLVQKELAQRFKGCPAMAQTAAVRQLRTTAGPAIAVEISSVAVEDRAELDHMAPGVADAIAHGVAAFRPLYVQATPPGLAGGTQP